MSAECYPIAVLPHTTQLYRDYLAMSDHGAVRTWYGGTPLGGEWMRSVPAVSSVDGADAGHRDRLAAALEAECLAYGAGAKALENVTKLRHGARAVVTGQQVGLFGGPLLTLLKAATAIARAEEATRVSGIDHVPVFWLATEDHDLAEVDQVALPSKTALEKLSAGLKTAVPVPVGGVPLDGTLEAVLDQASELLAYAPVCDDLREFYTPAAGSPATLGGAFARFMARVFADQGLIVMDAAGREFHALGATTLRAAIERAEEFETALLARTTELERHHYHAQVLVKPGASLLFLLDETTGERLPLRRLPEGVWKAGHKSYTHRRTARYPRRPARAHQPQRAAAPRLPGHHPAHRSLRRRTGRGCLFRAERRPVRAYSPAHHARAAAPDRYVDRARAGRCDGPPRTHPARRDGDARGPRPASRRPRHAHRRQAQARRRGQRHGRGVDRAHRVSRPRWMRALAAPPRSPPRRCATR